MCANIYLYWYQVYIEFEQILRNRIFISDLYLYRFGLKRKGCDSNVFYQCYKAILSKPTKVPFEHDAAEDRIEY